MVVTLRLLRILFALGAVPAHGASVLSPLGQQVRAFLELQESATQYELVEESEFHPRRIAERALVRPSGDREFCESLGQLELGELVNFEDVMAGFTCEREVALRLDAHWKTESLRLAIERWEMRKSNLERLGAVRHNFVEIEGLEEPIRQEERELNPVLSPYLTDGGLKEGEIALTLDDGPHPTRTTKIFEILAKAGARANFFSVGQMARSYPQVAADGVRQGHVYGSHSMSHAELPKLTPGQAQTEILSGAKAVADATGVEVPFFRFPYGAQTFSLKQFVQAKGFAAFSWNLDPQDWKIKDPVALLRAVVAELNRQKHGILLMHDIQPQTVLVLPAVLEEIKRRGWKLILFTPPRAVPPI